MNVKMLSIVLIVICLNVALGKPAPQPQFLTFRDGKFGVNFGGYHAEAGLGGLLTGNSAHGGLSASAGTPFGQRAGAGLGGALNDNDRATGGAWAGASAGYGVGASAAIGGGLGAEGGAGGTGAEAHAGGVSTKVVKLGQTHSAPNEIVVVKESNEYDNRIEANSGVNTRSMVKQIEQEIQAPFEEEASKHTRTYHKKKVVSHPHKVVYVTKSINHPTTQTVQSYENNFDYSKFFDFGFFSNVAAGFSHPEPRPQTTYVRKTVQPQPETIYVEEAIVPVHKIKEVHLDSRVGTEAEAGVGGTQIVATSSHNRNFWNDIFNIPISTLTAVNQLLNNKSAAGGIEVHKTVGVHHN